VGNGERAKRGRAFGGLKPGFGRKLYRLGRPCGGGQAGRCHFTKRFLTMKGRVGNKLKEYVAWLNLAEKNGFHFPAQINQKGHEGREALL